MCDPGSGAARKSGAHLSRSMQARKLREDFADEIVRRGLGDAHSAELARSDALICLREPNVPVHVGRLPGETTHEDQGLSLLGPSTRTVCSVLINARFFRRLTAA